jgi:hyperosmotically inducible periplasmic protein
MFHSVICIRGDVFFSIKNTNLRKYPFPSGSLAGSVAAGGCVLPITTLRLFVNGTPIVCSPAEEVLMKTASHSLCALSLALAGAMTAFAQSGSADRIGSLPGAASQARIVQEVRHQLVLLPYYTVFDNLAYKVEGSAVTLMGQVTQPVTKDNAERAVKGVEGVTKVINQIQVLPLSPMDSQIRRAEFLAIYRAPGFEKYSDQAVPPIHIIVDNGHVTLVGVVLNQMDKQIAYMRANSVPDVFSVTNDLRVENQ